MRDAHRLRIQRELFLAAFGSSAGTSEGRLTDRLVSVLEEQYARAGETLYLVGDPPESYYVLREGSVRLVREGTAPWKYEGRSVFGMSDALLDRPRSRTALAVTDVHAMKVQYEAWMELLEDSFDLARAAVRGAVRSVAGLEERLWAVEARSPAMGSRRLAIPEGPLEVLSRLAVLTETSLLRGAGVQLLADLAGGSEVVTFERGEVLVERGTDPGRVLVVIKGGVEASREAPDAQWRGGPGDVVCGMAAFGDPIRAWQAGAITAGRALSFRIEDWFDLLEEHFEVVRSTLAALALESERLLEVLA
jgi:CRP-like cAMP-binding protein